MSTIDPNQSNDIKTNDAGTNANTNDSAAILGAVDGQITDNTNVAVAVAVVVESKASKARKVWDREVAANGGDASKLVRKDIIKMLKAECELTDAGAATYYQKMKEAAGLVNHKPAAPVAATTAAVTTTAPADEHSVTGATDATA